MKSFPYCRQLDVMDCGPASLKIIAKYYGKDLSVKYIRDKCNSNREGVSIKDLARVSEEIGLRNLPIKLTFDDLADKIKLPCIIHWNSNHFVVLYRISRRKVFVSDPQTGLVKYTLEEFQFGWKRSNEKGVVLVIETSPLFFQQVNHRINNGLTRYATYLREHLGLIARVMFAMIVGIPLSLAFPFITQSIVDIGIETRDLDFINVLLGASIALTLSSILSGYLQSRMMLYVADRTNISMVSDFIRKTLNLPITFFERKMTIDVLNRVNDHNRVQEFVLNAVVAIVVSALTMIAYSCILLYYHVQLFWIFIAGSALYVLWIFLFLRRRRQLDYKYFDATVENQNEVMQIVENQTEIKINNLQQRKRWDWEKSRLEIYNLNVRLLNVTQSQSVGGTVIDRIKNLVLTFISAKAVISGELTLGMMLSAQYIIGQMNGPVSQFIGFVQSYQNARISMERIGEVIHEEKEEPGFDGIELSVPERKNLCLKNLSFRYSNGGPWILKNISMEIPEGKMVALVGQSGSGKSSLLKLLLRLYSDYDGEITVGDVNLKSIDVHKWRAKCGAVLQDGKILDDTILRNIVLDTEHIDVAKLNRVIALANLHDFLSQTNLKLYTLLGRGGQGISGGQKQRVLIARALYKDPELIFFDEATNSLDAKNEHEIAMNLREAIAGKTSVVIAHRLSTIQSADLIIVLDKGEIVEQGTHEELLALNGHYYNLVSHQINFSSVT